MIIHNNSGQPVIGLESVLRSLRMSGLGLAKFSSNDSAAVKKLLTHLLGSNLDDSISEDIDRISDILLSNSLDMPAEILEAPGHSLDECARLSFSQLREQRDAYHQELAALHLSSAKITNSWKGWVLRFFSINLTGK